MIINTKCGAIEGIDSPFDPNVEIFRGIRYAKANRFSLPILVDKWEGVYDATSFKACCFQQRAFEDESKNPSKKFYYNEFRKDDTFTYSEDCLFLNIWREKNANNAPVLIYVHGGSFLGGCGNEKHFQGEKWCEKGVIVVTINYRLGPLGFLNVNEMQGNFALHDIMAAINWIEKNIKDYGGDCNNITLAGQSAGAIAVTTLLLSKKVNHKAILLSGGGVGHFMNPGKYSKAKAQKFWNKVVEKLNLNSLNEIYSIPVDKIFEAFKEVSKHHPIASFYSCSPYIDNYFLLDKGTKIFKNLKQVDTPCILSSTSEDIVPPILFNMNKKWTRKFTNSYRAYFSINLPGDNKGAFHSSDLWYFFGSLDKCWRPFTEDDYNLSNLMIDYYSNFAKYSNPNLYGHNIWLKQTKGMSKVMVFNKNPYFGKINKCKLYLSLFGLHGKGEN